MKQKIFTIAMVAMFFTTSAMAQDAQQRRERQQNFDITEVYNRQATRLVKSMKLGDDVKDKFTVLYLDYQNARHNAVNPKGGDQEGQEQRVDFKTLTDEEATELIQKNFDRQEKQLAVDKEYLPKFLEILTPVQTAQVYLQRAGMQGRQDAVNQRQGGMRGGQGGFGGGRPGGGFGGGGGF